MCGKPTVNGEPGYSWDGKTISVRPPNPPDLSNADDLIFDEAGRCGGLDSHCHHFRLVRRYSQYVLLVRHGGGDQSFPLSAIERTGVLATLKALDSNARYWMLQTIYSAVDHERSRARENESAKWARAAAEKRIKLRRRRGTVKVEIVPAAA